MICGGLAQLNDGKMMNVKFRVLKRKRADSISLWGRLWNPSDFHLCIFERGEIWLTGGEAYWLDVSPPCHVSTAGTHESFSTIVRAHINVEPMFTLLSWNSCRFFNEFLLATDRAHKNVKPMFTLLSWHSCRFFNDFLFATAHKNMKPMFALLSQNSWKFFNNLFLPTARAHIYVKPMFTLLSWNLGKFSLRSVVGLHSRNIFLFYKSPAGTHESF